MSDKNSSDTGSLFDGDYDLSKIAENHLFWISDKIVQKPQKHQNQHKEEATEHLPEETVKEKHRCIKIKIKAKIFKRSRSGAQSSIKKGRLDADKRFSKIKNENGSL